MSALHRFMPQIMLILGILIVLASYFGDLIGLGITPGLGIRHLTGILLGSILAVNGLTVWAIRERS